MVNYQNSKIYELICSKTGLRYIGSSTQKLTSRLSEHKGKRNLCTSKNFINPKIFLIENVPCDSIHELHSIEREYIENTECVNKCIPNRTKTETKEYQKKWREKNRSLLQEKRKIYLIENKDQVRLSKKKYYDKIKNK
tara:strand:- start:198 stop:611 length:414 start_codon:yes stop_codon:yes gene_type:complete